MQNQSSQPLSSSFTAVFNRALIRTNERLSLYLGSLMWSFLILVITTTLGLSIFALIIGLYQSKTLELIPTALVTGVFSLLFLFGFYYIQVLINLTIVRTLIQDEYMGYFQTLKNTNVFVNRYISHVVWFTLISLLFIPLDIVISSVIRITLFQSLWGFWSIYTIFVIFDYSYKGRFNLYFSRQIVNMSFFQIILKNLLMWLMSMIIFIPLLIWMVLSFVNTSHTNLTITFLQIAAIVGLIFTFVFYAVPFLNAFSYELYRSLPKPTTLKKPSRYLFIAAVVGIIASIIMMAVNLPKYIEKTSKELRNQSLDTTKEDPSAKLIQQLLKLSK